MLPIASAHLQPVPLSKKDFKTWVLLDTFDMYSPAYDQPQTYSSVARLLEECGFINIRRHPHGGISITAMRQV
jgi:spermidine synthase